MTTEHGYSRYVQGCRCDICRTASATYQREARACAKARRDAAQANGERYVATGIKHGLYGYQRHYCRCFACRLAKAQSVAKWRAGRAAR